ncbi:MAG: phage tail tube protein [Alphaproteobacteria bacterium]|nr:phage tail tube protein [Alphaproteobacteria bacterium]
MAESLSTRMIGIASITVDGQKIDSKKGASLKLGGPKFNAEVYGETAYGSSEVVVSELDCDFPSSINAPIEKLRGLFGVIVLFQADNGISYQMRNAMVTEALELKGGDGIKLKMSGNPAEKM